MGFIQLNEKLVARLKILDSFETKAVGFCEHGPGPCCCYQVLHKIENRTDCQTCEWMNSMEFRVSLLAKHWTYQTLDKYINVVVVVLPI